MDTFPVLSKGKRDVAERRSSVMEKQSEDRRSRRSRRLLKEGLLQMMQEKRFSEITVRDITERMDLNRGTFYLHYPDTAALLQRVEEDMLAEAQALVDAHMAESTAERTLRPVLLPILDYVVEHRTIIGMLLDSSTASGFVDRLQKLIYRNGSRLTEAWFRDVSPEQLDYLMSFLTYGLIGLVKEWFGRGMDLPGEELVSMADRLVQGAAEGLLQM